MKLVIDKGYSFILEYPHKEVANMTIEKIDKWPGPKDPTKTIQVYFNKELGLHPLYVMPDIVDFFSIDNGFLKIHETGEQCWHCYNAKCVLHYHIPDCWNNGKCSGRVQNAKNQH